MDANTASLLLPICNPEVRSKNMDNMYIFSSLIDAQMNASSGFCLGAEMYCCKAIHAIKEKSFLDVFI
jgi:hypothetical protein